MGENFSVVEWQSGDAIAPSVSVRRMEFPDSSDKAVGILAPIRRCGLYGHEDDFTKPPGSGLDAPQRRVIFGASVVVTTRHIVHLPND